MVEDGEAVRKLVCEMLASNGYAVVEASNARDALTIWERDPESIDLVLTDVIMPHISGGELAQQLAERRPTTRILFMSGYTGEEILQQFQRLDEVFLQKPFTAHMLDEKIRLVLDRPWDGLEAFRRPVAG